MAEVIVDRLNQLSDELRGMTPAALARRRDHELYLQIMAGKMNARRQSVSDVRDLIGRFVRWTILNKVPADVTWMTTRLLIIGSGFKERKLKGWNLGLRHHPGNPACEPDPDPGWYSKLLVKRDGEIHLESHVRPGSFSVTAQRPVRSVREQSRREMMSNLGLYPTSTIEFDIAEIAARAGKSLARF